MVAYPGALPLDCAQSVIRIVREGRITEDRVEFAHCLWNMQGFAQKALIGEPMTHDHDKSFFGQEGPSEELLHTLGQALNDCELQLSSTLPTASPDDQSGDAITIIVTLLPLILQALKALGIIKQPQ